MAATRAPTRTTVFACGATLDRVGRQAVLRLSRPKAWQQTFLEYLRRRADPGSNCNAVRDGEANS